MDSPKYMLLINGQDKTDSVASFRFQDGMCEVVYASSPKDYRYRKEHGCINAVTTPSGVVGVAEWIGSDDRFRRR